MGEIVLKRYLTALILLLFTVFFGFADDIYLQVDAGHNGPINVLRYGRQKNYLFSAGEDGTVKIWEAGSGKLIRSIRVSFLPIKMLAVNPAKRQVAVLATDEINTFKISVWNWENGKAVFTYAMDSRPLFLTFTSRGTYLVVGKTAWESLIFLNAATGKKEKIAENIHGIVSFITFSRDENTLLLYQPSGKLFYVRRRNSEIVKSVDTLPGLQHINISDDKRFVIAVYRNSLVYIDVLSGAVLGRQELKSILDITLSSGGNEIAALVNENDKIQIKRFLILNKAFYSFGTGEEKTAKGKRGINTAAYGGNNLFLGFTDGTIMKLLPDGTDSPFAGNPLAVITDFNIIDGKLYIATPEKLFVFKSDFFKKKLEPVKAENYSVSVRILPNPLASPAGLILKKPDALVMWSKNTIPGKVLSMDSGITYSNTVLDFDTALLSVELYNNKILSVQDTGKCSIFNMDSGKVDFTCFAPGMHKIIMIDNKNLVGIRTRIGAYETPLVLINSKTGETVPIADTQTYIYDLTFDKYNKKLYTIGAEKENGKSFTVIKSYSGDFFDHSTVVDKYRGEDLSASLVVDENNGIVYSSVGYKGISIYYYGVKNKLESIDEIPRKLIVSGDKIFSLNRNSTITVWGRDNKKALFTLYLFSNDLWVFVLKQRGSFPMGYYTPPGGDKLINAVKQGRIIANYKRFYKLKLADGQ